MKNVDKVHKGMTFLLSEALKLLSKFNNNILHVSMTQMAPAAAYYVVSQFSYIIYMMSRFFHLLIACVGRRLNNFFSLLTKLLEGSLLLETLSSLSELVSEMGLSKKITQA